MIKFWLILVLSFITRGRCGADQPKLQIKSVRLETCSGCKLYDLPDLKDFIFEDFPKYKNAELKLVQGATPTFRFLTKDGKEVEAMFIHKFSRKQCNEMMVERGFKHKGHGANEL